MMETKPFNLQSPEAIAKDYGGNKQKIAQAAQMGLVDPTAAVLAGMFIDRMRSAQMQEQAPQATVAQQVLGGAPPAPPMAPPPMSGPPPAPMGADQGAMAGIAGLPVPDYMFPEEEAEPNYAGGGLVAFAGGASVSTNTRTSQSQSTTTKRTPLRGMALLEDLAQRSQFNPEEYNKGVESQLALVDRLAPRSTQARQALLDAVAVTPEQEKAQRSRDLWGTLAEIGFGMAGSNAPTFMQAAGESASKALPGMREAAKERRAQRLEGLKAAAGAESEDAQYALDRLSRATEMQDRAQAYMDKGWDRAQAVAQAQLDMEENAKNRAVQIAAARMSMSAQRYNSEQEFVNAWIAAHRGGGKSDAELRVEAMREYAKRGDTPRPFDMEPIYKSVDAYMENNANKFRKLTPSQYMAERGRLIASMMPNNPAAGVIDAAQLRD